MHSNPAAVLSAVTLVAALGLVGCADGGHPAAAPPSPASTLTTRPAIPAVVPLPSPDALTGVLYQLADTSIPAEQKVGMVQYATVDDQPALTNFGTALRANGFDPLTVAATDLTWAREPGHVIATVTIGSSNPRVNPFNFPMEFAPIRNTWQLSRRTADQLLPLVVAVQPTR